MVKDKYQNGYREWYKIVVTTAYSMVGTPSSKLSIAEEYHRIYMIYILFVKVDSKICHI